ncbi:jg10070 [Pararge aegeria aegeria]|uniref:Jg10070 protein n=1 Tax=Pararge aegeria aegeria TaxID=348720 RepID=A0A8S4SE84_9NEOP|nr:jg10070 [Pararge aegeria aegeria]
MPRNARRGFYANVASLPAPTEDSFHADNDKVGRSLISRYLDGDHDQSHRMTSRPFLLRAQSKASPPSLSVCDR